MLGGVCNGLAAYLNVDVTVVRVAFTALAVLTGGAVAVVYLLMMLLLPSANTSAEKAAAFGAPLTAQEFIRRAREGYYEGMKPSATRRRVVSGNGSSNGDMQGWSRDFQREMHENSHQWQKNWHGYWAQHPHYYAGAGLARPFLLLIRVALLLAGLGAAVSLLSTGAVFGVALPVGMPVWAGLIALFVVYHLVAWPFKVLRRAACYRGMYAPGWGGPLVGAGDVLVWIVFLVAVVCLADRHMPQVHEAMKNLPPVMHEAVDSVQRWWTNTNSSSPFAMKTLGLLFLLPLAAVVARADLLLVNGPIYTLNPAEPRAEAVLVRDGRIAAVGAREAVRNQAAGSPRVIDLAGKTLLPGLNDAHMHLVGVGFRELTFDLEGTKGVAELREKLKAKVVQAGPKKWIIGRGWIETHWQPAAFPHASDLDDLSPDNPVVLKRADGHAVVVNSLALRLAGIDLTTPNPPGGEILRDPKSGEATGMLVDGAMRLVERLVPPPTAAETEQALAVGAEREVRLGWTGIQIAGHSFEEAEMTRRLVAQGRIKLRIYDAVSGPGPDADKLFQAGAVLGESDGRYTRRAVKLYIDGALGSRGAALLEPYADYASNGLLVNPEEKLRPVLAEALHRGIQIETHAIGDRGKPDNARSL